MAVSANNSAVPANLSFMAWVSCVSFSEVDAVASISMPYRDRALVELPRVLPMRVAAVFRSTPIAAAKSCIDGITFSNPF